MDLVGRRVTLFLGESGRARLLNLVEEELKPEETHDVQPESRKLRGRLEKPSAKIDSVIDLAASSPEHQDLLTDCPGRLHKEKRAFVEGLTIEGASQSVEVRMKGFPVPEPRSTWSPFEPVAGAPRQTPASGETGVRIGLVGGPDS